MGDAGQQGLMRTTLLNPTVWLLAAMCVAGVIGAVRGRTARASVESLLRIACAWPVLIALVGLAVFGLGSRAVLGFLAPGAYAEEVIAARTFLEQSESRGGSPTAPASLYPTGGAAASTVFDDPAASAVLANLPWLSTCQGNAMANRARFYTDHAHTPMLLLAGVPVVYVGGAKLLYACLLVASFCAIALMAGVLIERAGLSWRSASGVLIIAAVAGWQPVLAGVRQGDAVLPAAGLLALAWYLVGRRSDDRAVLPAAFAACLAVPAIGVLPALWRTAPRAAAIATGLVLLIVAATVAASGFSVIPGFLQTVSETARTYASAPANYAIAGRALGTGAGTPALVALLALVLTCSWWRATTIDTAFAAFVVAGLMVAPVLWSQHLALLLIPMAVLFTRTLRDGSSLELALLAGLSLVFSLPDTVAIRVAQLSSSLTLLGISGALIVLWAWTAFSTEPGIEVRLAPSRLPASPPVHVP